jgi:putative NADPH-quinone reductase
MRVHVVYAHPLPDSYNAALHDRAVTALRGAGHEVDDLDGVDGPHSRHRSA